MCPFCSLRWHGPVEIGKGGCAQCLEARRVKPMTETYGETRDNVIAGSGDRDKPFAWGNPKACLTTLVIAHLLILRGRVRDDHEHGLLGGVLDGDTAVYRLTDVGLFVPKELVP